MMNKFFNKIETFIPYAYHYSHDSVLTKNGELIKIIKLEYNNAENNLREIITQFLLESKNLKYSIWITTIRSKTRNKFDSFEKTNLSQFASHRMEEWDQFIITDNILQNELYISIIINDLTHFSDIRSNFNLISDFGQKNYADNLRNCYGKCTIIANNFLHLLKDFSPSLITIYKINNNYYSGLLTFFSRITFINEDRPVPLPNKDLASFLADNNLIKSYYNTIKLSKKNNKEIKKFVSMFTIKDHSTIQKNITNELSEFDFELIVTETINLIDKEEINSKKNASYFNSLKKESEFLRNNNEDPLFKEFITSANKPELYLYKQTNIMVKADNLDNLDLYSYRLNLKFANNGVILYRHNVFIEETFWSQLPGNFNYVSRFNLVKLANIINFNTITTPKNDWQHSLIFKSKLNNSLLKLEIKNQNIFLFEGIKNSIDHAFLFFLFSFLRFKLKIYFVTNYIPLKGYYNYLTEEAKFYLNENKNINRDFLRQILLGVCVVLSKITNHTLANSINDQIELVIDYFLNQRISFDLNNILNSLKSAKILDEESSISNIIRKNLYFQNINFLIIEELDEKEYNILLICSMLKASLEKIILNLDIIFFIKNIKKLIANEDTKNIYFEILFFANQYNLICFCDLSECDNIQINAFNQAFKPEQIMNFIFPDSEHQILKQITIENLDQKIINSMFIKEGNKIFFVDFNIKSFIEGNQRIFEL